MDSSDPLTPGSGANPQEAARSRSPRAGAGRRRRWIRPQHVAGLLCLVLLLAARVWNPPLLETLRLMSFDFYQAFSPRPAPPRQVAIVDLDEESLAAIGQWPWPRTVLSEMVDRLMGLGAVAIGFDVIFAEPDRMSPARGAESLRGLDPATERTLRALPDSDAMFADAISRARVVLGQSVLERTVAVAPLPSAQAGEAAAAWPKTTFAEIGGDPRPFLLAFAGVVRNLPELERAAAGRGMVSLAPERDGIVRRVPAVLRTGADIHPAFSLELLRVAFGASAIAIRLSRAERAGIENLVVARLRVATDANGLIWLHFARHDPDRYVSAKDVLQGTLDPQLIAGKVVLVGTSAAGLKDIKATPVDSAMPGVEVHAQVIESILSGAQLVRPAGADGAEFLATLLIGLAMIVLVPLLGPWWTLSIGAASLGLVGGGSWYLFAAHKQLFDASFPTAANLAIYTVMSFANYARGEMERRQVRTAFSRYLSPALVNRLAANPEQLHVGGENRSVTVMFTDLQNFTTISERFDAVSLTSLLNRYFTPVTKVILDHAGTVDKYLGDSVMAFWNAPLDDPEHARHACLAALALAGEVNALNQALAAETQAQGRPAIVIKHGVGLNTGECCVGNLGSEQRFDYSVIGDAVNLASRLEGQTRAYGVPVIVGETTRAQALRIAFLEIDLIRVKGKTVPSRIFTPLGADGVAESPGFAALVEAQSAWLAAYRRRDWSTSLDLLASARASASGFDLEAYYTYFEKRVRAYAADPPGADWDGAFTAETK